MKHLRISILSIGVLLIFSACSADTNQLDTGESETTSQIPSEVTSTAEARPVKEKNVQENSANSLAVVATTQTINTPNGDQFPTVAETDQNDISESETKSQISSAVTPIVETSPVNENSVKDNSAKISEVSAATQTINLYIGDQSFQATLYDTPSAKALLKELPLTVEMRELNGNEKYFNLSKNLPSASARVNGIQAGDLMLYGSDCLVLFYESFSTSYSYTPLGRIEQPAGLTEALGNGNVSVTFELRK